MPKILATVTNHYFISSVLTIILAVFYYKVDSKKLLKFLFILLILNFVTFNGYLIATGTYDFNRHLPLHMCYITEVGLLLSLLLKTKILYPWILLNGLGGGLTGFTNSNLIEESQLIEHTQMHLSHFNLLLFTLIMYKEKFFISKHDFIKSIFFNLFIFAIAIIFNILFESNYWFTAKKADGVNLTNILPDWPYYIFIMIGIGLVSYSLTFRLFSKK